MRLPPNSHIFRMYSGGETWFYQVVGSQLGYYAVVLYAPEDGSEPWSTATVPMRWLRGSPRALAEALRQDAIEFERQSMFPLSQAA